MSVLSAQSIRWHCRGAAPMVSPFRERTVVNGKTFGLSAAGYDVRVEFEVGSVVRFSAPVFDPMGWNSHQGHQFMLASTVEEFCMPENVLGVVHDKSSWARKGLTVQNTIIEPGWRGFLTLELTYHGANDLIMLRNDPIAQIVFHKLDHETTQPYDGKYQDQARGPQEAIDEC